MRNFTTKLLSLWIWTAGFILTTLLFLVMLFFTIILYPFDKQRKVEHTQCFWWANALIKTNPFWKISISGLENINKNTTYVIIANHQSLADIIILYKTKMQFKWVAKASLFKVPILGWCMTLCKHIMLERGNFSSIKKVYHEASIYLKNNMSVLFFPEGTRSKTNEMNTFQNGAFKLAIKEKKPILPIVLKGTRDAIQKGSWIFNKKIYCTITICAPIETKNLTIGEFEKLKEAAMQSFIKINK